MEYYDRSGNIKKLNIDFEPLVREYMPQAHTSRRPTVYSGCCDDCSDDLCFYLRYKQYCSDNFIGKRQCAKLHAFNERQRMLDIILK